MRPVFVGFGLLAIVSLVVSGCGEETGDYVEITGGGFQYNYRLSEATYTLVASKRRSVPAGTVFIAEFENPEGGPRLVARLESIERQQRFPLTSPPVKGIRGGQTYAATLRLETPEGKPIESHETTYTAKLDSAILGDKPLTIGPGYARNPERPENQAPENQAPKD